MLLLGLTINRSKLFLMSTSQNLFVQNLSLLVFPLFEETGRLKKDEAKAQFSTGAN